MSTQEQNIEKLVDELSKLTVLDMSKLKDALEDKWGVKAAAGAPVMMAAAPAAEGDESKESTEFKVTLKEAPVDKKIGVIKAVREITGLGLKEAKELVEGAPKVLKESASKAEADEIVKKVSDAGGKVELAGL
ncbi:MAG: 50S ribosomal protein L7/L12 [Chlamydiae bacterium]|nr:50S ribosomal protein L7/L12 [Chlamydiota bacterium]